MLSMLPSNTKTNNANYSINLVDNRKGRLGNLNPKVRLNNFSRHGEVNNLFRLGRHLMKASNYKLIRGRSFVEWNKVSDVQNLA
jgi:hypothetical protein